MEEKQTLYINAIYQNIRTAIQSIADISTKVNSQKLATELAKEQDAYNNLEKECELFAKAENLDGLKDNNIIEKARLWTSIQMSTMIDNSSRKIAELMLIGTFMGIITCIKDRADHKNISKELDEILNKLINLEQENLQNLLPYLDEEN